MTRIAIFASGNGSNAENLIRNLTHGRVVLLLCNNPQAYVLQRAKRLHIPTVLFSKEELEDPSHKYSVLKLLKTHKIDFIILAGFLWKIPEDMIRAWPEKIVNIHPALLPKYGGPGMYGDRVHKAVMENGEKETGITIHIVDPQYDHGHIIYQESFQIYSSDTPKTIALRIHFLEQLRFPKVVDDYLKQLFKDPAV